MNRPLVDVDRRPPGVVGFTGTREGMTNKQSATFRDLVLWCKILHHGSCVGADAQAHEIARFIGVIINVHPPINKEFLAHCNDADFVFAPKPYMERNRDIVNAVPCLIATPKEQSEVSKGGTWQTVRYARKQGKRIIIIWPDGSTKDEAQGEVGNE